MDTTNHARTRTSRLHTCVHAHTRTCAHGPYSKQDPVSLTPVWRGRQSPDTPVCGLLHTGDSSAKGGENEDPRTEVRQSPRSGSLIQTQPFRPPRGGLFGNILESSSSASCLQNLLPSPGYELERPQGRGAHYIPGHSPQCRATQDIGRSLTCQPRDLKRSRPTFYSSVPWSATTNGVSAPTRLICHQAGTALL